MAVAVRNECLMFGDNVQLVAPDLSRYRHGVAGKFGVVLLGVVSESEEDCQLLTYVDGIQHLVKGSVLSISPLRTPPLTQLICCPQVSPIIKMFHSARMCLLFFNECIRTACLITGQMIMPYHSGNLQTKVPKLILIRFVGCVFIAMFSNL